MAFIKSIWEGVKSIVSGGVKVCVGTSQAAWLMLKLAFKAALWVVAGVFTMAVAGVEYVVDTISDFFTPREVNTLGSRVVLGLGEYINGLLKEGKVAKDDEPLLIDMGNKCKEASKKNQALIVSKGINDEGQETLAEPRFVQADDFENKIKEADEKGMIYVKPIKIA